MLSLLPLCPLTYIICLTNEIWNSTNRNDELIEYIKIRMRRTKVNYFNETKNAQLLLNIHNKFSLEYVKCSYLTPNILI